MARRARACATAACHTARRERLVGARGRGGGARGGEEKMSDGQKWRYHLGGGRWEMSLCGVFIAVCVRSDGEVVGGGGGWGEQVLE
jgi:hypothetical protein